MLTAGCPVAQPKAGVTSNSPAGVRAEGGEGGGPLPFPPRPAKQTGAHPSPPPPRDLGFGGEGLSTGAEPGARAAPEHRARREDAGGGGRRSVCHVDILFRKDGTLGPPSLPTEDAALHGRRLSPSPGGPRCAAATAQPASRRDRFPRPPHAVSVPRPACSGWDRAPRLVGSVGLGGRGACVSAVGARCPGRGEGCSPGVTGKHAWATARHACSHNKRLHGLPREHAARFLKASVSVFGAGEGKGQTDMEGVEQRPRTASCTPPTGIGPQPGPGP